MENSTYQFRKFCIKTFNLGFSLHGGGDDCKSSALKNLHTWFNSKGTHSIKTHTANRYNYNIAL